MLESVLLQEPRLAVARQPAVGAYVFDFLVLFGPHEAMVVEVKGDAAVGSDDAFDRVRFQCDGYRKATGFPVLLVAGDAKAETVRTTLFSDRETEANLSNSIPVADLPRRIIEILEANRHLADTSVQTA